MRNKKYILPVLFTLMFAGNLFVFAEVALADPWAPGQPTQTYPPTNPGPTGGGTPSSPGPTGGGPITRLQNPLKVNSIQELLKLILEIVTLFATPVIVFFIIYAGFLFVTARGNDAQLTKAKNALLWSLIGGAIILGANILLIVITNTVNSLKV